MFGSRRNSDDFLILQVALDQLRTVARERLIRRLGVVSPKTAYTVSNVLVEMFTR